MAVSEGEPQLPTSAEKSGRSGPGEQCQPPGHHIKDRVSRGLRDLPDHLLAGVLRRSARETGVKEQPPTDITGCHSNRALFIPVAVCGL